MVRASCIRFSLLVKKRTSQENLQPVFERGILIRTSPTEG